MSSLDVHQLAVYGLWPQRLQSHNQRLVFSAVAVHDQLNGVACIAARSRSVQAIIKSSDVSVPETKNKTVDRAQTGR